MRDDQVHALYRGLAVEIQKIGQFIGNLQQNIRLDSTGKEIRLIAFQKLLIKKGLITEAEMTEQVGAVIQEMQQEAEEAAKKAETELTKPTAEQVQQVEATKTEVAPVAPPQA